ncbi:MAG: MOSC domain-containing protein [Deltaproteobacteria bacterium]|nr:MAG: MOSC domain-containing protein [Deltaproteobacteria bacterium]TMB43503.1 MAG: MOSC domain-containing protein [Deltaproteobacteria bacterium]
MPLLLFEAVTSAGNDPQTGRVEFIHLAQSEGEPMRATDRIRALAGIGLEGDRYASGRGHFSKTPGTGRALTLIEAEVLEHLRDSLGIALRPGEGRRNLTTRGVALNALVGHRFHIGNLLCEGMRLCEPCKYLEELIRKPLVDPLLHRGGLRADVLEDGEIRIGDEVRLVNPG